MSRFSEEDDEDEMPDLTGPPQLADPKPIIIPLVQIRFTDLRDLWRQIKRWRPWKR